MPISDDDQGHDRVLERTNLDEHAHRYWRRNGSHFGYGKKSGLAPSEKSSMVLLSGVDPCQGSSLSSPPRTDSYTRGINFDIKNYCSKNSLQYNFLVVNFRGSFVRELLTTSKISGITVVLYAVI